MNLESLKSTFKAVFLKWVISQIDADAIRHVLSGVVEAMKSKAETTANPYDDAAVGALEYILAKDGHLDAIFEHLRAKLTSEPGICESTTDEIEALAVEICKQPEGICESSTAVAVIVQVLQAVLPLLLAYLTDKKEPNTNAKSE